MAGIGARRAEEAAVVAQSDLLAAGVMLAARDLGYVSAQEASTRIAVTLDSVSRLERHEASGQFYNWYDPLGDLDVRLLSQNMTRLFLGGYVGHPVAESALPHTTAG